MKKDNGAAELERLRRDHGLTQQEVADLAHVTVRTAQRWLAGDRLVPPWALRLLRLELGLAEPAIGRGGAKH